MLPVRLYLRFFFFFFPLSFLHLHQLIYCTLGCRQCIVLLCCTDKLLYLLKNRLNSKNKGSETAGGVSAVSDSVSDYMVLQSSVPVSLLQGFCIFFCLELLLSSSLVVFSLVLHKSREYWLEYDVTEYIDITAAGRMKLQNENSDESSFFDTHNTQLTLLVQNTLLRRMLN
mmetsp:Transcript_2886/g.4149  ORF Transcript_2886/g.4149 Transcript_2886/m.4149 type:complete len:171 (+) Transcript_2886:2318-2830(+)